MDAAWTCETAVPIYQSTWRHNPEDLESPWEPQICDKNFCDLVSYNYRYTAAGLPYKYPGNPTNTKIVQGPQEKKQ